VRARSGDISTAHGARRPRTGTAWNGFRFFGLDPPAPAL
jgi:hypothetical protein